MNTSDSFPFRIPKRRGGRPSDPETLFRSLSQRAPHVQHLWAHQADILRKWYSGHVDSPNLALELPTGTGKTLIGLLIGEFVRQTTDQRVAYLCPNRQLAHQVGSLAGDYSIDARVLVGQQAMYDPNDFNAFEDSSALAVTTYSAIFNTNPRIRSANLLILDDAHASEDFIASLWNVDISRFDHRDVYLDLLDFFEDAIPGFQLWNLRNESTAYARSESGKIPSTVVNRRLPELRDFLDSTLAELDLRHSWSMIRAHLEACHVFFTWQSISIRPITPPTHSHAPFAEASQRIYMSATLGEGGELERITGVRKIERLPVPEGWEREGTGRRFIIFPERSLPPETARTVATTLLAEPTRALVLTPNRYMADLVIEELSSLSPRPVIFRAQDVENSLQAFLSEKHAALVLQNRYDGLDLPGDACHLEWICGLPAATNAQEAFLLNRLGIHSLLRDRIRTRLTQALGRCTRNPTDHAVVIVSGYGALDFCIKNENRSGFHPELQAEIEYGLDGSKVSWPGELLRQARAFLQRDQGWERVDEWIREERDSYPQREDNTARTLMDNVGDEIDYAEALWVGNYQGALERARACADRLSGAALADYRAWWYYLAGSAAMVWAQKENLAHLPDVALDQFTRACAASPRSTWFREAARLADLELPDQSLSDPLVIATAEAIEKRIQQFGVTGIAFETEAKEMIDKLDSADAKSFEQGLERLGFWLGVEAIRPKGRGVPDGVWTFAGESAIAFEAKSNEQNEGPISLGTAREAQGHINWVSSNLQIESSMQIAAVVISDREMVASEAMPNTEALFVVELASIRRLCRKVASVVRALRAEATETDSEEFRKTIAKRLKDEEIGPRNIQATFKRKPLSDFPVWP